MESDSQVGCANSDFMPEARAIFECEDIAGLLALNSSSFKLNAREQDQCLNVCQFDIFALVTLAHVQIYVCRAAFWESGLSFGQESCAPRWHAPAIFWLHHLQNK